MSLRQVNGSALCKQALRFILTKKKNKKKRWGGRENSVISKSYERNSFSHRICNQCFPKISLSSFQCLHFLWSKYNLHGITIHGYTLSYVTATNPWHYFYKILYMKYITMYSTFIDWIKAAPFKTSYNLLERKSFIAICGLTKAAIYWSLLQVLIVCISLLKSNMVR